MAEAIQYVQIVQVIKFYYGKTKYNKEKKQHFFVITVLLNNYVDVNFLWTGQILSCTIRSSPLTENV